MESTCNQGQCDDSTSDLNASAIRDRSMNRVFAFALFFLVPTAACAHQRPPFPTLAAPAVVFYDNDSPALPTSAMAIPIAVPLAELTQLLRERMVIPDVPDWKQVSDDPDVSIRYAAELLTPRIASEGQTLRLVLPVAYYGSFKARAKTPFGSMWLTKGSNWGDAERRGLIEVEVASQLDISSTWQLTTSTSLADLRFTAPPISKVCTSGAFKICVPADMVADRVHRELDARVREKAASGLGEVDAQVAQRVDLPRVAQRVWEGLHGARAGLPSGETIALMPEQLAVSYPTVQGDMLVAELRVWGRPTVADATPQAVPPLPPPSTTAWAGNDLNFLARVSLPTLNDAFTQHARSGEPLSSGHKLDKLAVLGLMASRQDRWLMAATFVVDEQPFTVYLSGDLLPDGQALRFGNAQVHSESAALIAAAGLTSEQVVQRVNELRGDLSGVLAGYLSAVRLALAQGVAPWPASAFDTAQLSIKWAYTRSGELSLAVNAR